MQHGEYFKQLNNQGQEEDANAIYNHVLCKQVLCKQDHLFRRFMGTEYAIVDTKEENRGIPLNCSCPRKGMTKQHFDCELTDERMQLLKAIKRGDVTCIRKSFNINWNFVYPPADGNKDAEAWCRSPLCLLVRPDEGNFERMMVSHGGPCIAPARQSQRRSSHLPTFRGVFAKRCGTSLSRMSSPKPTPIPTSRPRTGDRLQFTAALKATSWL